MLMHPDSNYAYARLHLENLLAEAQLESLVRTFDEPSYLRRLTVATGRLLERVGERLQGIPATPLTLQSERG